MKFSSGLALGAAALSPIAIAQPAVAQNQAEGQAEQPAEPQHSSPVKARQQPLEADSRDTDRMLKAPQPKEFAGGTAALPANQLTIIAQDYRPAPAMWLLSDKDTSIYMFGTYHVLPPGFRWRSDLFNQVVNDADELVIETSDMDSARANQELAPVMAGKTGDRSRISGRLSPENSAKWLKLGELLGYDHDTFDHTPLLLSVLGFSAIQSKDQGARPEYGVESVLQAQFARLGKPVGSIEDASHVTLSLASIDDAELLAQVDSDLSNWDGLDLDSFFRPPPAIAKNSAPPLSIRKNGRSGRAAVIQQERPEPVVQYSFWEEHSWARGEPQPIAVNAFGDNEFGLAVYEALLVKRNRAWATWLQDRLDQPGTVLLAVGAGHLAGEGSVMEMLDALGLKAERVQ